MPEKKQVGFTLLELIIVLAVLAILGSVAVARFVDMGKKAASIQEDATMGSLRTAVLLFKAMNDYWPAELGKDGPDPYHRDILELLENPPPHLFFGIAPGDGRTWEMLTGATAGSQGYWISCPHLAKKWFYCRQNGLLYMAGQIVSWQNNPH
ncbi:MAG: type II secretion system protein [Candidatus Omnitrophota bacterium]